ncbi:MAG: BTAD domain-containing putative transcriptional regulator [Ilumatobacteraceae bacterium]|nr:BTAD domain-containing putative transcriptional regulator [Ilumatobacteraceae bacterium]
MEVRLLGGIEVDLDDEAGIRIGAAKARWLLAFLALHVGSSRSVDSIIDALWGEHPPPSAPNLVQGYISDLRKIVGHSRITTTEHGYALALDGSAVDAVRFRELVRRARAAAEAAEPRLALTLLAEALALGADRPFGEAAPDGPLAAVSVRLTEQWVDAAELHADTLVRLGAHHEAIAALDELIEQYPYREGLRATLAIALYRSERQVDALRSLAESRRVLADELGVSPGRRLVEVEQQILDHDPALDAPPIAQGASPLSGAMVGRTAEVARIRNRLAQTKHGAQHTIFVGGEPGIGKTTLAAEVARIAADDDTVVLVGRCDEHVAAPYRPFVEALTDHVRSIGDDVAEALLGRRRDVVAEVIPSLRNERAGRPSDEHTSSAAAITLLERFDTFCWILQQIQGSRNLILILEDLQWADSATLRLLHYLAAGHRLPGSMTIGTHRTTEAAELFDDILADLRTEPQVERMLLAGLPATDLMLLMPSGPLSSDDDTAGWVYRETDGNPFLAIEIIGHIAETGSRDGVPVGVTEVVERRLRRLSPETRRLLEYAAVLGEAAPVGLLRRFAGVVSDVPAALAEATQAGILDEVDHGERQYRFTHAILRKAATASMSVLHLEDLHVAAARAWASQPRSEGVSAAVASHYFAAADAADLDDAVEAFTEAGEESDRSGAKVEAVKWYDRALSRLPADDLRRTPLRLKRFVAAQSAWHWLHGDYARTRVTEPT